MKIAIHIKDFKPWGEAKNVWNRIISANKLGEFNKLLNDYYDTDTIDADTLNSLLWFDGDEVLNDLGLLRQKSFSEKSLRRNSGRHSLRESIESNIDRVVITYSDAEDYVIYSTDTGFEGTKISNWNQRIQDERAIHDFSEFTTFGDCVDYVDNYFPKEIAGLKVFAGNSLIRLLRDELELVAIVKGNAIDTGCDSYGEAIDYLDSNFLNR